MNSILGMRIRECRKRRKISQAALAASVDISPSYLNLIEHNKRTIGGALLLKIANALDLEAHDLEDTTERHLQTSLTEIAQIPDITKLGIEENRINEFIGRFPGWSRAIAVIARSERTAIEKAQAIANRISHDQSLKQTTHQILSSIAAIRSAAEILVETKDLKQNDRNVFQQMIYKQSHSLTHIGEALATYLNKPDQAEKILTPTDEVESLFDHYHNHFSELEAAANRLQNKLKTTNLISRLEKAKQLSKQQLSPTIQNIIASYPRITTELAEKKAQKILHQYAVHALLTPLKYFQPVAQKQRYDIETLAEIFSVPVEVIYQRLTALRKESNTPSFGYYQTNAAGTIIIVHNIQSLDIPRYTTACPLWVLYRAQQSPEAIIRQRASFPSGNQHIFLARARSQGTTGFGKPRHYLTDMIALSEDDSQHTVYAPQADTPIEPVGISCRSCPRKNCIHRVADPLIG